MKKCEACGSYIITQEDIEGLRKSSYGHPDPVGEPGIAGVDGVHDVILEPRHLGRWIDISVEPDRVRWKCSSCGKETGLPNYDKANYCFNCGAKMLREDI